MFVETVLCAGPYLTQLSLLVWRQDLPDLRMRMRALYRRVSLEHGHICRPSADGTFIDDSGRHRVIQRRARGPEAIEERRAGLLVLLGDLPDLFALGLADVQCP